MNSQSDLLINFAGKKARKAIFPAEIASLDKICDFVTEDCDEKEINPDDLNALKIALEELFVNIVSYAYETNGSVEITSYTDSSEGIVEVCLEDSGKAFNPLEKANPELGMDVEDMPIGGLGIFMAKQCTDGMEYRREAEKNQILFWKKVRLDGKPESE